MKRLPPSEGIYFVARFPDQWRLIAFRFDEHPEGGHSEFWEEKVAPALAKAWTPQFFQKCSANEVTRQQDRLCLELAAHYDGFPRGRIVWSKELDRFVAFHGSNVKRSTKVTRAMIEAAFGISGRSEWEFDEHEQCSTFSAEGVCSSLRLRERWKTITAEFW